MDPKLNLLFLELKEKGYSILAKLGKGLSGVVYLAEQRRGGKKVCVKIFTPQTEHHYRRERRVLRYLQARRAASESYVVELVEAFEWRAFGVVVTEFAGQTSLAQLPSPVAEEEGKALFRHMASALLQLAAEGVVHHDLKLDNFVVDRKTGKVTLLDFAFSLLPPHEEADPSVWVSGPPPPPPLPLPLPPLDQPPQLLPLEEPQREDKGAAGQEPQRGGAPPDHRRRGEVVAAEYVRGSAGFCSRQQLRREEHHGGKSDVFGLGVCLYFLLAGRFPFETSSLPLLLQSMSSPPPPVENCSDHLNDLLRRMLATREEDRYLISDVLRHPWLSSTSSASAELCTTECSDGSAEPSDCASVAVS